MNNIDILEDYIELIEKGYCEDCNELCNISTAPSYPSKAVAQAISTLIAENKELKEKNKELEEELEKEKEKSKELESDIQQKNFEIKCLNSDIKNMYCEEGVIAILEDNFDLSREEAIQILGEE